MRMFIVILALVFVAKSQNACTTYNTEHDCTDTNTCVWIDDECKCGSDVALDIILAVDSSGSIEHDSDDLGNSDWVVIKTFLNGLVDGMNIDSTRIGIVLFATGWNISAELKFWDTKDELSTHINGLHHTGGWTNTDALLDEAIPHFIQQSGTIGQKRSKILLLMTDGNPCVEGKCPHSVCEYEKILKDANIRVVIIGFGDGWNIDYVGCLTQSDDDIIPVAGFNVDHFDSIFDSLSDTFCPISHEFEITEIKAGEKPFIEIYNAETKSNADALNGNNIEQGVGQKRIVIFLDPLLINVLILVCGSLTIIGLGLWCYNIYGEKQCWSSETQSYEKTREYNSDPEDIALK